MKKNIKEEFNFFFNKWLQTCQNHKLLSYISQIDH
jgi:hypothetical protein